MIFFGETIEGLREGGLRNPDLELLTETDFPVLRALLGAEESGLYSTIAGPAVV